MAEKLKEADELIGELARLIVFILLALFLCYAGFNYYRSNKFSSEFEEIYELMSQKTNLRQYCNEGSGGAARSSPTVFLWLDMIGSRASAYSHAKYAQSAESASKAFEASGDIQAASEAKSEAEKRWEVSFRRYLDSLCAELERKRRSY